MLHYISWLKNAWCRRTDNRADLILVKEVITHRNRKNTKSSDLLVEDCFKTRSSENTKTLQEHGLSQFSDNGKEIGTMQKSTPPSPQNQGGLDLPRHLEKNRDRGGKDETTSCHISKKLRDRGGGIMNGLCTIIKPGERRIPSWRITCASW